MICGKCHSDNLVDAVFCAECGARIEQACSACGTTNPPNSKFCRKCGNRLAAAEAQLASTRAAAIGTSGRITPGGPSEELQGERKTVTALFADIKGSMELMEDLDPEEARAIVDPALKLMIEAVRRYDGYVVQSTGDGIFALFGAPVAHEDHPQRALYAALRLQEELKLYSDRMRQQGRLPLQARVGVNTGEVVVRSIQTGDAHTEYTPIGHTANLAARMQVLAPIGSIAATEQVRKLCEGYFLFNGLGPTKVKGVSEPVNVYEVTGLGPLRTRLQRSAGRGLTKFVGREREMEALKHAAEQAKSGHGQIVAAMAEPGVGKSRLLFEFKATSQSGWMVLEAFSVSHGKASAYLPVIDLLRNYFDISATENERKRREKVTGRVLALDRSLEDALPYLFSLLGIVEGDDTLAQMDGQIKKRRTLEMIKRIVLRESLNQPLMVIFEDLHWIDEQTQELLNLLADSIGTAKLLLLVNYRPEYLHQWSSKTYYTQLRLDPLGTENAEEMLSALLGEGPELEPLKRLVIERTEGNPFFMEEMVQVLFDEAALVRNGAVKLARPLSGIQIPPTVQGILAARIDRLPPDEKDLLQTLAVIGREFALSLVRRVVDGRKDDELERMLADLQMAEFIYEQPAAGDVEYVFKHALTQEVAYNSILVERRKPIHGRAAQAIEWLFAANLADHYDDLARHYQRSGDAAKAVDYLRLAAQQAINRSAYLQASDQLNVALELLRRQPDDGERDRTEIAILLSLTVSMMYGDSGFLSPALIEILARARALCERVGDDVSLFEVLEHLAFSYSTRWDLRKSRALGEELLRIALRIADPSMVRRARFALGRSSMWEANFTSAIEEFEQAGEAPPASQKRQTAFGNWRIRNQSLAALTLWILGYPERALVRSKESLTIARETMASPADLTFALFWSAFLNLQLRDPGTAHSRADEAFKLAHEHGLISFQNLIGFARGWALGQLGQIENGLFEMVRSHTAMRQNMSAAFWLFQGLADVYLAIGRPRDGLEVVREGLEFIRHTGGDFSVPEMLRLKAELLLLGDNGATAEAAECLRDGIELAQRQSAKSWELRATMSLAHLLAKQGKRDEARAMLAEIYGWFTEGFDTADLKDSKALLDELRA